MSRVLKKKKKRKEEKEKKKEKEKSKRKGSAHKARNKKPSLKLNEGSESAAKGQLLRHLAFIHTTREGILILIQSMLHITANFIRYILKVFGCIYLSQKVYILIIRV